jgi:hypothetical protein
MTRPNTKDEVSGRSIKMETSLVAQFFTQASRKGRKNGTRTSMRVQNSAVEVQAARQLRDTLETDRRLDI